METTTLRFEVARRDLAVTHLAQAHQPPLQDGEALLKLDRFAFTTNNVTYAETGDSIGYWRFFPADEGWGVVPVWGFADVVESRCDGLAVGERIYGFLPMATHLVVAPQKLREGSFVDATPHRAEDEDLQALLRPMFITSFLIDDFLADEGFFGATRVLVSSASSKTAIGLAQLLHRRGGVEVVALTSPANRSFVAELGCYHRVLGYDELETLDAQVPTVYVDFAGSAGLRHRIHAHLGERLAYSCAVGLAQRDLQRREQALPGPKPIFFFAPDRLKKRAQDWGRDGIEPRVAEQWQGFVAFARRWLSVRHGRGPEAVQAAWVAALDGRVPPSVGQVLSL